MNILRSKYPHLAMAAVSLLLLSSASLAQPAGDPPALRCDLNGTERLLTIVYPELAEGGGCRVVYEKPDEGLAPRVLWRANNDLGFCTRKLNVSAEKLTASGWDCRQREDAAAYSLSLAAALPTIEAQSASAADRKTSSTPSAPAASVAANPAIARTPVAEPALPAKKAMATPDADRALPEKDTAASLATGANTAQPQSQSVATAPVRTKTNDGEYDDWLFRWDEVGKRLVFTLYNSKDGTKVHNFSWVHDQMDEAANSPSNIVLAQDEHANQVLIIAWPGKDSQHITVLDPLVRERPVCEIETLSKRDSDWGYGVEEKKLFLKGYKPSEGNPAELVEFREECTYVR